MITPTQRYAQDLRRYYKLPVVQVSLTIVLSLFVISIFFVFALRPTIVSIVTLKKTIAESQKIIKQLDAKVANLQKAATQLDTIKSFLPTLNTNIPNNGAMYLPLTTAVELLAQQTGTKLESNSLGPTLLYSRILSPYTANKNQSVVTLPFTVRVTGSYAGVSQFLKTLLSMERIIMFNTVAMTKESAAKTSEEIVAMTINGDAFYLADESQLQKSLEVTKGIK